MLEILFIFGLIGLGLGMAWEYLSTFAAFPTMVVSLIGVPLVALTYYHETLHHSDLQGVGTRRAPVPPERFYWAMYRPRLGWMIFWLVPISVAAWYAAIQYPADMVLTPDSVIGWVTGGAAIFATGRLITACVVYIRASHWFDRMAPWLIGACRRALYRFSENPDFLGETPPERPGKDKTVY